MAVGAQKGAWDSDKSTCCPESGYMRYRDMRSIPHDMGVWYSSTYSAPRGASWAPRTVGVYRP
eukprot:scaffold18_cov111-Isochrysis_galbana.AAC.7